MLSTLAVAALASAAIAAPASATVWLYNGIPLPGGSSASIDISGEITRSLSGVLSYTCPFEGEITVHQGANAEVTDFDVTSWACSAGGLLAGCTTKETSATTPWEVQVVGLSTLKIYNAEIASTFDPMCPLKQWNFKEDITMSVNSTYKITEFTLNGLGKSLPLKGSGKVTSAGAYGWEG